MWVHLLSGTKYNQPLLLPPAKDGILTHLESLLEEMGCYSKQITAMPDHVHLLFICKPTLALSEVVKHLKGNSSHWINDKDLTRIKFVWDKGFTGFSESDERVPVILKRLNEQEEYHKTKTFMQEVDELIGEHTVGGGWGDDSGRRTRLGVV
jgi:putative transposase